MIKACKKLSAEQLAKRTEEAAEHGAVYKHPTPRSFAVMDLRDGYNPKTDCWDEVDHLSEY